MKTNTYVINSLENISEKFYQASLGEEHVKGMTAFCVGSESIKDKIEGC